MTGDLIQDIDNAMRQERTERLWREYGPYIIGGAVLAVLLTGGLSGWQGWKARQAQQDTARLQQALESKDKTAALDSVAPSLHPGPKVVASLTAAGLLLETGKTEEALKHYEAASKDEAIPALYRDLATWMAVRLDGSLHADKASPQALLARLGPLLADASNPWHFHAQVEAAQITGHGLKDIKGARERLASVIAAEKAPPSLKQRAEALDHVYRLQEAKENQAG